MRKPFLSIIVPCYRSGDWLADLASRVKSVMASQDWTYELILVNDLGIDCDKNQWSVVAKIKPEHRLISTRSASVLEAKQRWKKL